MVKTTPIAIEVEEKGLVVRPVGVAPYRGSRPVEGLAAGRTSNASWIGVHDAALLGFAHLFGPVDRSRADLPQTNAQACVEGEDGEEEGPGHGLLMLGRSSPKSHGKPSDADHIQCDTQVERQCVHDLRCLRFLLGGAAGFGPREITARDLPRDASQLLESSGVFCGHISLLLPGIDGLAAYSELTCKS